MRHLLLSFSLSVIPITSYASPIMVKDDGATLQIQTTQSNTLMFATKDKSQSGALTLYNYGTSDITNLKLTPSALANGSLTIFPGTCTTTLGSGPNLPS